MIVTAHEHSYERTALMDRFNPQIVADYSKTNPLELWEGRSFAFVTGLGGVDIRLGYWNLMKNDWWQSILTSNSTVVPDFGATFCTYYPNGENNKASCYFKDIQNRTLDTFEVIRCPMHPSCILSPALNNIIVIPYGSSFSYNYTDPIIANWYTISYNDPIWLVGNAPFGFGDPIVYGIFFFFL